MKIFNLVLIGFMVGCGSAPTGSTNAATLSGNNGPDLFTGTWKGTQTGTQNGTSFSQTITAILTNVNGSVTGTWMTAYGTVGTLTGTVSGSTINSFTLIEPVGPCAGSGSGNFTLTTSLAGSVQGNFGTCGLEISNLSLSKVP